VQERDRAIEICSHRLRARRLKAHAGAADLIGGRRRMVVILLLRECRRRCHQDERQREAEMRLHKQTS
jgi:hypothetical protein